MSLPLNKTELIAWCEELGYLNVHRRMSEDELHALIKKGPFAVRLPILQANQERVALMRMISQNWEQVVPLLSCPARSGSPTACFTCTDLQVGYCAVENQDLLQSVKVSKKELEDMSKNTLQSFVPRTAADWTAIGNDTDKSQRTKLMAAMVALGVTPVEAATKYKTVEEKVAVVMKLQEENGLVPEGAAPKAGKAPKSASASAVKATSAVGTTAPKAATTPASSGGGVGNADVSALKAEIEELKEGMASMAETLGEMMSFVKDTHCLVRAAYALETMDEEVATSLHGQLLVEDSSGNG